MHRNRIYSERTASSERLSSRPQRRFAHQASGSSCRRGYGWDADLPRPSRRLRSRAARGRFRIQARDSEALLKGWLERWPYSNLRWLGYTWVEPEMEDVFMAYSQRYFADTGLENRRAQARGN